MASSSGKRTSSSGRTRKSTTSSRNRQAQRSAQDSELFHEIGLIVLFVAMLILFCCNFGIIGPVGNAISGVLFGIFGFTAYIAPIVIFLAVAFWFANEGNPTAVRKMIAGVVLFLMIGVSRRLPVPWNSTISSCYIRTAAPAKKAAVFWQAVSVICCYIIWRP